MSVTSVSTDLIESYVRTGFIQITGDTQYEEAEKLKEEKNPSWETSKKIDALFLSCAKNYVEQASQENDTLLKAFFYGKARYVLKKQFEYPNKDVRALREQVIFEEAKACLEASFKQAAPQNNADLLSHAVYILSLNPRKIPNNYPKDNYEKHELASKCWERLGDLHLKDKKEIRSLLQFYAYPPKWVAACCYQKAAFAMRNTTDFSNYPDKYTWSKFDNKRIELLDKATQTLKGASLKMDRPEFSGNVYKKLAEFQQMKLNLYRVRKEGADLMEGLKADIFKYRKKSAKYFDEVIETDPNCSIAYYQKALNLREAAYHVKTVGQAHKLLEKAAQAAVVYRKNHGFSWWPTGSETSKTRNALDALYQYNHMITRLEKEGAEALL